MAGDTTKPRVAAPSSGIGDIAELVKLVSGETTQSTQTGDTGALSAIIAELAANNGPQQQALLESIFQQAAGKIPGIMGNTYNATGSRAAPGKLSPQLQDLMSQVTLAAQQQLASQSLQNSGQRVQAGQAIAGANRTASNVQATGATKFLQDVTKLAGANSAVKSLTGGKFDPFDKLKSGVEQVASMFSGGSGSPGLSVSGAAPAGAGMSADLSGLNIGSNLNPGSLSVALDAASALNGTNWAAALDPTMPDFTSASAVQAPDTSGLNLGSNLEFGSTSVADPGLSLTDPDFANFSLSSDGATTSESGSNYGSYLKLAKYADNPSQVKDIFGFSDGDWKDDISDVTDAASIAAPPLGMVRPALNLVDSFDKSAGEFVTNPQGFIDGLLHGENDFVNANIQLADGVVQTVVDTGDMLGRAGETVGNAVGDVFESIGDFFGF